MPCSAYCNLPLGGSIQMGLLAIRDDHVERIEVREFDRKDRRKRPWPIANRSLARR